MDTILLSISIYLIIVFGYFIIRNFIDLSKVTTNLIGNMGIDVSNYLYVTIYISFINSFLEEFFYRGSAFVTLKKHINKKMKKSMNTKCIELSTTEKQDST